MIVRLVPATIFALSMMAGAVHGQVSFEGTLVAEKACAAVSSIKKGTNPGNVSLVAGQRYTVSGKNRDRASHYWITVPGANPPLRWVAVACGRIDGAAGAAEAEAPHTTSEPFYVLALSWEPSFCEGLPGKAECRSMVAGRADTKQFSLHGLWPQPRRTVFCSVAKALVQADEQHRWEDLPVAAMRAETRAALDAVMPGTQSLLERHEWIKHGTCYPSASADQYFSDAARLTRAVNESAVGAFVAAHAGQEIAAADLRAAFDRAFFAGAGDRVRVACKPDGQRQLIAEITIGLKGDIPGGVPLADLIEASAPTDPGCPSGVLDGAGLQ